MRNKKGLWLFILALVVLIIGVAGLVAAIVFELLGNKDLFEIFGLLVIVCGPISILLFTLKLSLYGGAPSSKKNIVINKDPEKPVVTVDVKEPEKTQEEIMYDKYVDLYNQKLITKEDLEKKRIELLGK